MIRILVVDDHRVVRAGLIALLQTQPHFHVIGQADDGEQAIAMADQHNPDVILMDIRMPVMDGVTATRRLKENNWPGHILILTTYDDDELIWEALRAGARGYMLKDAPPEQLYDNIRQVAAGESILSPTVTDKLLRRIATKGTDDKTEGNDSTGASSPPVSSQQEDDVARTPPLPLEPLTPREMDILQLIARGMANKTIAGELFISENTVKTHISNVLRKLEANDRAEAVAKGLAFGMIHIT